VHTNFFADLFGGLEKFDRNFAKIVAPSGGGNANYVVYLKEWSLTNKRRKTALKSTHKP